MGLQVVQSIPSKRSVSLSLGLIHSLQWRISDTFNCCPHLGHVPIAAARRIIGESGSASSVNSNTRLLKTVPQPFRSAEARTERRVTFGLSVGRSWPINCFAGKMHKVDAREGDDSNGPTTVRTARV